MTKDEYQHVQYALSMLASMFVQDHLDFPAFVATAERANETAPFVDPTLWRAAHTRLDAILDLARAAVAFQRAARGFQATMREIAEKEKR
jgi:hypothetical protein